MSDYISREAVLSSRSVIEVYDANEDIVDWGVSFDTIKAIPAADVAPVVYGEWIEYACSAYGGIDEYGDVKRIPKKKFLHKECGRWNAIREPFCPNCGAKMGGKQ